MAAAARGGLVAAHERGVEVVEHGPDGQRGRHRHGGLEVVRVGATHAASSSTTTVAWLRLVSRYWRTSSWVSPAAAIALAEDRQWTCRRSSPGTYSRSAWNARSLGETASVETPSRSRSRPAPSDSSGTIGGRTRISVTSVQVRSREKSPERVPPAGGGRPDPDHATTLGADGERLLVPAADTQQGDPVAVHGLPDGQVEQRGQQPAGGEVGQPDPGGDGVAGHHAHRFHGEVHRHAGPPQQERQDQHHQHQTGGREHGELTPLGAGGHHGREHAEPEDGPPVGLDHPQPPARRRTRHDRSGHPVRGWGDGVEQVPDDVLDRHPAELRLRVEQEPVAEHRFGERLDVVGDDVVAAVRGRPGLGHPDEGEAAAGGQAELDVRHPPGLLAELGDVPDHGGVDVHVVGQSAHLGDRLRRDRRLDQGGAVADPRVGEQLHGGRAVGVAQGGLHQEAVELGLGQPVGAGLLDGVLGGDDHERATDRVGDAVDGDPSLLHHLQQRGLGLGRGAVDLVGQDDGVEDRPGVELEGALVLVVDGHAGDVGGQQVGRELDPGVAAADGVGQGPGQHRLAGAREVLQQDVALGQQAGQGEAYDVPLAEDGLLHVVGQLVEGLLEPAGLLEGDRHGAAFVGGGRRAWGSVGRAGARLVGPGVPVGGGPCVARVVARRFDPAARGAEVELGLGRRTVRDRGEGGVDVARPARSRCRSPARRSRSSGA